MPENCATSRVAFAHRYCKDGTIDSICLCCYQTACQSRTLRQSLEEEAKHVCEYDPNSGRPILRVRTMSASR